MEWFRPSTFDGYYTNYGSTIDANFVETDGDATDSLFSAMALFPTIETAEDGTQGYPGFGCVNGMPMPGTTWKIQFSRYSETAVPAYTNWVGDTGGFVTRPFGDLVFGLASASDVREALMHLNN